MAASVQDIVREGGGVPSDLLDWMISQGLLGTKAEDVFEGFTERLVAHGLPINRAYAAMRILHPLYLGFGLIWRRGQPGVKEERYGASPVRSEAWLKSPLRLLIEEDVPELRRRIAGPEIAEEFPVLEEFRQEGATDYFATACRFGFDGEHADSRGIIFSWTTDRPGGFSDAEIDLLRQAVRPLALTMRVGANRRLPVPNFSAGGIATPADAALMMQLGAEAVFVGSGVFKSSDPERRARAIVQATTHYKDPDVLAKVSEELGEAMVGL